MYFIKGLKFFILLIQFLFIANLQAENAIDLNAELKQAVKLLNQGHFKLSETLFSRLPGYRARIGYALSKYKQLEIIEAKNIFLSSVLLANSDKQRFLSLFNAAGCAFSAGQYADAEILYSDSLRYQPEHSRAIHWLNMSVQLKRLVLSELEKKALKQNNKQSGPGKLSITIDEAMFDREASITMEDSDDNDNNYKFLQTELESDNELLEQLLDKGIMAITLNSSPRNIIEVEDENIYSEEDITSDASTPLTAADELWRRLFELEYNIPAALERKESVPGLRQW